MTPLQVVTTSPRSPQTGHRVAVGNVKPLETRALMFADPRRALVIALSELAGRWRARRVTS